MRMTRQRSLILQELQKSCQHMTADDLYDAVRKHEPRVSLATVYRNLELLSDAGIIGKIALGGRQKIFDADPSRHHHITCCVCHRVDNLEGFEGVDNLLGQVNSSEYQITTSRLEVVGICPSCAQKNGSTSKTNGEKTMAGCGTKGLTEEQKAILDALVKIDGPCGTKDIAAESGLETKTITSKMPALKKKGFVGNPARCKYGITDEGKAALNE